MGDMNIHVTWLTHVRTGPKKKIAAWVWGEVTRKPIVCPRCALASAVFWPRHCYGHCSNSIQVLLSPLEIIVHHIVYSTPLDFSAT